MLKNISNQLSKILSLVFLYAVVPMTQAFAQPAPRVDSIELKNPIKVNSIQELLVTVLNIIIIIAMPIIVIFIIFAGFKYVTARGNASQIEEASRALTYAIIGGVLVIGAVAIAEIIKNLVSSF